MASTKSKEAAKTKKNKSEKNWASKMLSPFDEMDREFDLMLRRGHFPFRSGLNLWHGEQAFEGKVPSVDIIDKDDKIVIKAELPGIDKKDVDISVTDETVSIKGHSSYDKKEEKSNFYRREIACGSFERILAIPANVDSSKAKAKFNDGILELTLPKTKKSNRKKIEIK